MKKPAILLITSTLTACATEPAAPPLSWQETVQPTASGYQVTAKQPTLESARAQALSHARAACDNEGKRPTNWIETTETNEPDSELGKAADSIVKNALYRSTGYWNSEEYYWKVSASFTCE